MQCSLTLHYIISFTNLFQLSPYHDVRVYSNFTHYFFSSAGTSGSLRIFPSITISQLLTVLNQQPPLLYSYFLVYTTISLVYSLYIQLSLFMRHSNRLLILFAHYKPFYTSTIYKIANWSHFSVSSFNSRLNFLLHAFPFCYRINEGTNYSSYSLLKRSGRPSSIANGRSGFACESYYHSLCCNICLLTNF